MSDDVRALVDHLFRLRAGQMIATLARVFGAEHLSLVEEVVQDALLTALQQWRIGGVPENPGGWLFRVARNKALDQLRRDASLRGKEIALRRAIPDHVDAQDPAFGRELRDDTLRMILMCCHPAIGEESRIALTLKVVSGFSVDEIARAFLTNAETIAQRIVRAKRLLREKGMALEMPAAADVPLRSQSVLKVLYLLFNEGYNAHSGDQLIRRDLYDEAIRLTGEVVAHPLTESPAAHALLALMLLQAARFPARVDGRGDLILLGEQNRKLWDAAMIADGMRHFDRSAAGETLTAYHVEAAIAACHAGAPSFAETDWRQIVRLYDDLLTLQPSPVVALNRAIALAMAEGPDAGIAAVAPFADHPSLRDYLPLPATLGELWLRRGNRERAARHFARALELPATPPERRLLLRKLEQCRA